MTINVTARDIITVAPGVTTIGSGTDKLALMMSEDAYQGDAQLTVSVDGKQVGGIMSVTASHAAGATQEVDVLGSFSAGSHAVSVNFLNDAYGGSATTDRNLYLNSASINGTTVARASLSLLNGRAQGFSFTKTVVAALLSPPAGNDTGGAAGRGGSLLPTGYLSTHGNQIVDSAGNPVRIASIGWSGTDSLSFAPYGLWQSSLQQNIDGIKADGFNTIRVPWSDLLLQATPEFNSSYAAFNPSLDPELQGLSSLQLLDVLVSDASKAGLKIIFDHHDNEGGPGGWGGQQANGLWFDTGPGSNGTDGSGTAGTVSAAKFLADSVVLAQHYAGNSTVIGFDLENEPTSAGAINWGKGGPTDIQAMYTSVGNAVEAADPGALIIAEGPEEWSGPAPGMPAGFAEGDLSGVASDPVSLTVANKVVYSVHEYAPDLSGNGSYNSAQQIAIMNAGWGYLETQDIAPVWIGETGSNLTSANDQTWEQGIVDYMNGKDGAQGGPTFSGADQPVSGSWWQWGAAFGQDPEGVETTWGSGSYWPAQQVATDQLLYRPSGVAAMTTTVAAAGSGATMQFLTPAIGTLALSEVLAPANSATSLVATVSDTGTLPSNGCTVEIDTAATLKAMTGGVLTNPSINVYLFTPAANDMQLVAGGMVSFSLQVNTGITTASIAGRLLTTQIT